MTFTVIKGFGDSHVRRELVYVATPIFKDDISNIQRQLLVWIDRHHHIPNVGLQKATLKGGPYNRQYTIM